MTSSQKSEHWYYVLDGQPQGPASVEDMHKLIEQKIILPSTLVCPVGGSIWYAAREWNVLWAKTSETPTPLTNDVARSVPPQAQSAPPLVAKAVNVPVSELRNSESSAATKDSKAKQFARAFWLFVGTSLLTSAVIYLLLISHNRLILFLPGNLIMMHLEYLSPAKDAIPNPNYGLLISLLLVQLGFAVNLTRHYGEDAWHWSGMAIIAILVFGLFGCMAIAIDAWRRLAILRHQGDPGCLNRAAFLFLLIAFVPILISLILPAIQAAKNAVDKKNAEQQSSLSSSYTPKQGIRSYFFERSFSLELSTDWQVIPEYNFKPGMLAYQNPKTDFGLFVYRDLIRDSNIVEFAGWADQKHAAGVKPIKQPPPEWQARNLGGKAGLFREYTVTINDAAGFYTLQSFLVDQSPAMTHIIVVFPTAASQSHRSEVEAILNSIKFHSD